MIISLGLTSAWAWDSSLARCDEALRKKGLCGISAPIVEAPAQHVLPVEAPVATTPRYEYIPIEVQYSDRYVQTKLRAREKTMSDPEWGSNQALLVHVQAIDRHISEYVAQRLTAEK